MILIGEVESIFIFGKFTVIDDDIVRLFWHLSIFNLRHEHLLSFCILWYWAFLANCVGRVATVILSIVNLHHEHLISLCILCIGHFWKTVLGVLQQSF
jgi:hypothetical protein